MQEYWLWLSMRPKWTCSGIQGLLRRFSDARALYEGAALDFAAIPGLRQGQAEALLDKDLEPALGVLAQCKKENIQIITWEDEAYPAALRQISDPPVVLYCKGQLPDLTAMPAIGIVGTRYSTPYGNQTAARLGYQVGRCGGAVVSGGAAGVDALAMEGALEAGAPVIGVLGCGVDIVYPAANRRLFERVTRQGCLLSQYPPGTEPTRWTFPERNRIISGLSNGIVVVEAPEKSGALITARQAAKQGRDVFAVPGNVGLKSNLGSNALLRQGALMATEGWDLVGRYAAAYPQTVRECHDPYEGKLPFQNRENTAPTAQTAKKGIDKIPRPPYSDGCKSTPVLTPAQQKLTQLLRCGPVAADDLVAASGLPAPDVMANLTLLEIQGVVRTLPGRRVQLN